MAERRIINKPKEKAPEVVDVSTENITIKEPTVLTTEDRITAIENYLVSADPYIKSIGELQDIKAKLTLFNDEITRIAGIQARANSYIDNKFSQIDQTLEAIVAIIKKHDDDFNALISDDEPLNLYEDEPEPVAETSPKPKE